ncbi:MAG: hypothetical protein E7019_02650 [Alphaproteobacteria bacterium]|nr:hypothetical protein [Alphaproteobacteria bacterium]
MGKKICNRADEMAFKALKKALEEDKLHLCLVESKVNRPTSPVYNPWEALLPMLIPVILGLILIIAVGPIFGLVFMIAAIFVSSNIVKKKLENRLLDRTKKFFVSSYANCCALWDFGGLVLVKSDDTKKGCIAPDADWKDFVIQNYADLMIEKKIEENINIETEKTPENETPRQRRRTRRQ